MELFSRWRFLPPKCVQKRAHGHALRQLAQCRQADYRFLVQHQLLPRAGALREIAKEGN